MSKWASPVQSRKNFFINVEGGRQPELSTKWQDRRSIPEKPSSHTVSHHSKTYVLFLYYDYDRLRPYLLRPPRIFRKFCIVLFPLMTFVYEYKHYSAHGTAVTVISHLLKTPLFLSQEKEYLPFAYCHNRCEKRFNINGPNSLLL